MSAFGDYSRTFLFYKQLFLGWMKLRNVVEVSQLKYSSDQAPPATPATLFANRGQLLVPFYSNGCLFVKQKNVLAKNGSAKRVVVKHGAASI
jgi:hypothetical protein